MDAVTFQVLMNLKIVSTGILMWFFLNKKISKSQWVGLFLLTIGSTMAQLASISPEDKTSEATEKQQYFGSFLGLFLVVTHSIVSGFAGVYSESLLKKKMSQSIHISNVQLYIWGFLFNLSALFYRESGWLSTKGFFHGYNKITCLIILNSSFMGLLISMVMKYLDNIVKVYMNSIAMVVSMCISMIIYGWTPSLMFLCAVITVIYSVYLYNK